MSAAAMLTEAFDTAIDELDLLVSRIVAEPPELWLDFDPWSHRNTPWIVKNGRANDEAYARFAQRGEAVRFMEAVCARTPGARIDYDSLFPFDATQAKQR
jgi:hypothetical protein